MTDIQQKQLDWLNENVKVKLAPSKIQGIGVFALRTINKGETLLADIQPIGFNLPFSEFDNLNIEVREQLLGQWPNIVNGSMFAYPSTRIQAYINHALRPNYDAINDCFLKKVKKGEEITENYCLIEGYKQIFPWINETKEAIMKS